MKINPTESMIWKNLSMPFWEYAVIAIEAEITSPVIPEEIMFNDFDNSHSL